MSVTWEEFKALVDEELKRQGLSTDIKIHYIDIHGDDKDIDVFAEVDDLQFTTGYISIF